jgi:hypothetical protein
MGERGLPDNILICNYMLYKHTTQKLYICDPQTQLNNFFTLPKISLHVSAPTGHLQVIFVYFRGFLSIVYIQIKKQ